MHRMELVLLIMLLALAAVYLARRHVIGAPGDGPLCVATARLQGKVARGSLRVVFFRQVGTRLSRLIALGEGALSLVGGPCAQALVEKKNGLEPLGILAVDRR